MQITTEMHSALYLRRTSARNVLQFPNNAVIFVQSLLHTAFLVTYRCWFISIQGTSQTAWREEQPQVLLEAGGRTDGWQPLVSLCQCRTTARLRHKALQPWQSSFPWSTPCRSIKVREVGREWGSRSEIRRRRPKEDFLKAGSVCHWNPFTCTHGFSVLNLPAL